MSFTIHKWILNASTGPSPTRITEVGNYNIRRKNNQFGPKLVRNEFRVFLQIVLLVPQYGPSLCGLPFANYCSICKAFQAEKNTSR